MGELKFLLLGFAFVANLAAAISGFNRIARVPLDLEKKLERESFYGPTPIEETLDFTALKLYRSPQGKLVPVLAGAQSIFVDNQPELPKIVRTFSVPSGFAAKVYLENIKTEESAQALVLEKTPPSAIWEGFFPGMVFEDTHNEQFFPGQLFKTHLENGALTVVLFPVQVEKSTQKTVVLSSAFLRINFIPDPRELFRKDSEGIILTSEKLRDSAEKLQFLHSKRFGVRSEIVTVESLEPSEKPIAESELPDGYKDKGDTDTGILSTYPYELSRKIIHYMHERIQESLRLRYVTILGDSSFVPPSYYYSVPQSDKVTYGVTDLCYGAIKKCLVPKVAVGRLPFSSAAEVNTYLKKMDRWLYHLSSDADHELSLFGGKAFNGNFQIGELGTLNTLNPFDVNWRGVEKFYKTNFKYDKQAVLNLFTGKTGSLFGYHADHGLGNRLFVEREWVTSDEILKLRHVDLAERDPVVVSISCVNGAFDERYLKEPLYDEQFGQMSIGVASLKSKAGAIAYLGSARPALGSPLFAVDEFGNLNLRATNYGLEILEKSLEYYRKNQPERLGDMILGMYSAYLRSNNDLTQDPRSLWTFLNVTLLGDPAMVLPSRRSTESSYGLARSMTSFEKDDFFPIPWLRFKTKTDFLLKAAAPSEVSMSLLKLTPLGPLDQRIETVMTRDFSGNFEMSVPISEDANRTHFMIRLENRRGVPQEKIVRFQTILSP